ncbi:MULTISPECIES: RodZ domain-containing protein [unclassified Granulicatella]|uniref:helix-turn-helix domain-containing protein n=1 Tax=unclassified Granulicatella TaxID=2630493 RepID=UPI001073EF92|nr:MULTISPECIES: RodZ domain-containing protein [unclassified Granulicatella]MBF0779917.1 helix-turn-helix domain-containing protein [Granulicatella sp. 19428wC4_WM01]TFU96028.1 helix-turn-helix domain-containing protein [Granulicatella sp. WM01]
MSTLGSKLKEKREELGLTLEEVSQKIEIQQRYLQALEDDRLHVIPGEYYIKEFVKKYATVLKLDGNKLLSELSKQKLEEETTQAIPVVNTPEKPIMVEDDSNTVCLEEMNEQEESTDKASAPLNKKRVSLAILLGCLILGGVGYAIWQSIQSTTNILHVQSETSTQETSSISLQSEQTTTSIETTTTTSTATTVETTQETTTQETTHAVIETTQASRVPSSDGFADLYNKHTGVGQKTYGLGYSYAGYNGEYNFVLQVSEPTWIRASVSGRTIYENTLQPGVPITITASQAASDVNFLIGISSAVSLTMNDERVVIPTNSRVLNLNFDLTK